MDLGHNCQSFGRSFSQGLYPGLFGNPPLPEKRSLSKQLAMQAPLLVHPMLTQGQLTLRPQRVAASDLDLREDAQG